MRKSVRGRVRVLRIELEFESESYRNMDSSPTRLHCTVPWTLRLSISINTILSPLKEQKNIATIPISGRLFQAPNWVLVRGTTHVRASADRRRRPTSATNRQSLERYGGARPCRALYIRERPCSFSNCNYCMLG